MKHWNSQTNRFNNSKNYNSINNTLEQRDMALRENNFKQYIQGKLESFVISGENGKIF